MAENWKRRRRISSGIYDHLEWVFLDFTLIPKTNTIRFRTLLTSWRAFVALDSALFAWRAWVRISPNADSLVEV